VSSFIAEKLDELHREGQYLEYGEAYAIFNPHTPHCGFGSPAD
jgi:hypothetical protein